MERCPVCGHENLDGALICDECGEMLVQSAPIKTTQSLAGAKEKETEATQPTIERRRSDFPADGKVTLDFEASESKEIVVEEEVTLGRVDEHTSFLPDVNLSPYGAWERGVSRLHASLRHASDDLYIIDLGSTNGTYVNGRRLEPRDPELLSSGDSIRLGLLKFTIRYQPQ